ncbi:hypothetical protein ELH50_01150 [Rhizobium ruizarguesonis]|uniref:hypothetical protein n=1 Tax=Rhizobium ruizarguesonis TaxID=2081791 RepID=UPI00102F6661|nr:hypothetical protein [Rhizobium ruizarguesonis]TBB09806.1 hypothetical protein ELH50_01150 [Rhizobium ruizarguesonis]
MASRKSKKPYAERPDLDKLESNWKKVSGFISRGEWSAAITRAATAAEIAANIAVRHELQEYRLESGFVDHLLIWANGLAGKLDKILRPLHTTKEKQAVFRALKKQAERINSQRNLVVHSGHFMNKKEAEEVLELSQSFIENLLAPYHPSYELPKTNASRKAKVPL